MLDLNFRIEGVRAERSAAAPTLLFQLGIIEPPRRDGSVTDIHTVALRCQVRIEPARRRYKPGEQERLLDLFGTPERWGQTVRPMVWTHAGVVVPAFTGETTVELPVPCSYDFSLAATRYFDALEGGDIPLCFLFSGTVFHEADGRLQVAPIGWEKEASFRLSADAWRELMDHYYPNSAWLCLRKDVFDRLVRYKSRAGFATLEQALEQLLTAEEEAVAP